MTFLPRAKWRLALLPPSAALLLSQPGAAQTAKPAATPVPATKAAPELPAPKYIQPAGTTPWIYRGSDVPQDKEWVFGEMPNGVRYAVRKNGVPPGQVSIRVRIDAGSLYEKPSERGYAHLLEHLVFRESKYLGFAQAIPTWQRLGATFGSDTNAQTSPTSTVFQLDLPNIDEPKLDESMKLLSGMIEAPTLSERDVTTERPIVLAEMRENAGAAQRSSDKIRETLFNGQLLATRTPIGTEETLDAATSKSVKAFYNRWYRPENTVVVAVGDMDPKLLASAIEKYFGNWKVKGKPTPAPSFGEPKAPADADPADPVGKTAVIVEPDLPRTLTYAWLRPWHKVNDTVAYNQGILRDQLALAIINRRLETHARAGGSYLYAQVSQDKVSRSADITSVSLAPLTGNWQKSLDDVRSVIADARDNPPSKAEMDREIAELQQVFQSAVAERSVQAGSKLADDIVNAVDIRESVASPETVLKVFDGMKDTITPKQILESTRRMFSGTVKRAAYVTPKEGEATDKQLRDALLAKVKPDASSRLSVKPVSFAKLPAIGKPGTIAKDVPIGVLDIEQINFANGAKVLLWPNDAEPGRVSVKVRFGGGYRSFSADDTAYIALGKMALVGSGEATLNQDDLDQISTGRKMGFNFDIDDGTFSFSAQTRQEDLADQLYLFAAKLALPQWDKAPVTRAKAAATLAYDSYSTSPSGVLSRDLDSLERNGDPRYAYPTKAQLAAATPEGFEKVWAPLLKQGPLEVLVFGDFKRDEAIEALKKTFGALPPREPLPADVASRVPDFPESGKTVVLHHRGDPNQAAAVIAWPTGGGVSGIRESRQLEILTQVFNNRLLDAMREKAGASYSPVVRSDWPTDINGGGNITALAQLQPKDVPIFFREADRIAEDLTKAPPTADELERVTEPLRQYISRASTGNLFWLYQLEGSTVDPRRIAYLRTLLGDYSQTTPQIMEALAQKYFGGKQGWRLAIIPEGQTLASAPASSGSNGDTPATQPATKTSPKPVGR
ncbi:MAG: insulinase family protein [Sphingomonadaceae bacterium]